MRLALILAALVAVPILVVVVWGAMLPMNHVASRRARFAKSPGEIWATVTGFAAFPSWRTDVTSVEVTSPTSWREKSKHEEIAFEAIELDAPRRMVSRIGPGLPFGGTWTYELTPDGTGTQLVITERGEVYNPLFRFMSRYVFGHTATLETYLKQLGARFGEQTQPSA